jgi:gamma-glutamyl:cysteine ligase YbdK (ATP-grasp superfamily)
VSRSTDNLEGEIESIAEFMENDLAELRPALVCIEQHASHHGCERALKIVWAQVEDLAKQAAWLRKFAYEDEQYIDEDETKKPEEAT